MATERRIFEKVAANLSRSTPNLNHFSTMAALFGGKPVLVTGGAGYIGTHTVVEMIAAGLTPVVLDNLINAKAGGLIELSAPTKIPLVCAHVVVVGVPASRHTHALSPHTVSWYMSCPPCPLLRRCVFSDDFVAGVTLSLCIQARVQCWTC